MNELKQNQQHGSVDPELVAVVREALSPITQRLDQHQTQLDEMRQRGMRPDEDTVLDIEEQLAEVRAEMRAEVRKLSQQGLLEGQTRKQDDVWDGVFIRNPEALRKGILEHGSFEDGIKARAFDTTDLATAGKLNPEQASQFIDSVIAEQDTLSRIRTLPMNAPKRLIEELTLAKRKIRAATEGTAPSELAGVATRKRELTTVEVILPEDITLSAIEDNIERGGIEAHISRILATQLGNDMNDLAWNGNAAFTSTDTALQAFISINDGFFQIMGADASVNDYDATGDTTHTEVLNSTLATMPNKYKRGGLTHNFFVPVEFAEGYLEQLSARATALGDTVLRSGLPAVPYFGVLLIAESAIDPSDAKLVLTPADNLVFGIQRDVRIEGEWQPRKRVVEYTLTARTDYELADPNAVVLTANIPSGLLS